MDRFESDPGRGGWDDTEVQFMSRRYLAGRSGRRVPFEEYLSDIAEEHDEAGYYLENGSWMGEGRPPREDEAHLRTGDNRCYYLAQTCLGPMFEYAEGYAVADDGAIAHAWLVREGEPVEQSPRLQGMDIEYFGATFPEDLVRDAMVDRGTAEPIVEAVLD